MMRNIRPLAGANRRGPLRPGRDLSGSTPTLSIARLLREVDEPYALVFAFHSPELNCGSSTTYGMLLSATRLASPWISCRICGFGCVQPLKVFAGAASPRDLERHCGASDALAVISPGRN